MLRKRAFPLTPRPSLGRSEPLPPIAAVTTPPRSCNLWLAAIALLWIFGGCSFSATVGEDAEAVPPGRIAITDQIGRRVVISSSPERIISLAPSVTETLYYLGADDRLIGVTNFCDWPEAAKKKPKVGNLLNPNYEVILAARPDLVIATTGGNDQSAVLKLAELGLPVFVTAPRSVDMIFETVRSIGDAVGRTDHAAELVQQMKRRLEDVRRRLQGVEPVRALLITWFDPLLAPGRNTFENDVLLQAGVISVTADIDDFYPRYSLEQVIAEKPDVILTVPHNLKTVEDLTLLPGWRDLPAVRNRRVYHLNEEIQHPSPRFLDGVEALAKTLYPERFR